MIVSHRRHAALLPALVLFATLAACGGPDSEQSSRPKNTPLRFPVEVETVTTRRVEYSIQAVGSIEAFEQVAVTARVSGVVERVRFQEGDTVGPDKVMAEIEPDRFRLALASARAAQEKTRAARDEAGLGLERRKGVNEKNPDLVRAEEVDAWRTRLASAAADLAQATTAVELAELNLRDALVRPPTVGVVQTRNVETGRYVQPGAVIATLVRREPLLLRFRVPEIEAAPLAPGMIARFTLRGRREASYAALLTLVGAAADPRDRMVQVTARIDDPARGDLRPGAFAEVSVAIGTAAEAPVIPQTAIRPTERGFLAFVVEGETARERVLDLGLRTADGQVEVRSGLVAGDRLVVRGGEALTDGAIIVESSLEAQR